MARAVWLDKDGNRYHRHFQASVAINRASGTKILIEENEEIPMPTKMDSSGRPCA